MGLTSDFTGHIICSPDTKRMLLDLEPERERQWLDKGIRETKIKRFGGLAAKRGIDGKLVDRIVGHLFFQRPFGLMTAGSVAIWTT